MASIHKRPGTPYFHAAWRQDGRLFLRSTKQSDRTKAMTVALKYERAGKLAEAGSLTEQQAREVLNDILEATGEIIRCPSIKDWLDEWLGGKDLARANSTAVRYRQTVENLKTHLGNRATRPLNALTSLDLQKFMESRLNDGCSPGTVIVDIKTLRAALNAARRRGLVTVNVAEGIDLPRRNAVERGTFTPGEVRLLVDSATGDWKTLVLLGYFTGQRLGDCLAVVWDDIDLTAGTISFKQGKTGKTVVVPMHHDLQHHLEAIAGDADGPLLPKLCNANVGGAHGVSRRFTDLMQSAGIDTRSVKGAGKRNMARKSFHALRHSFTSALANAGVAAELRMKMTGHATESAHAGYTHTELETLKQAVEKLPGL